MLPAWGTKVGTGEKDAVGTHFRGALGAQAYWFFLIVSSSSRAGSLYPAGVGAFLGAFGSAGVLSGGFELTLVPGMAVTETSVLTVTFQIPVRAQD